MILAEHACIVNDTLLYIIEMYNMIKLMVSNMIGRVTRHRLRH